MVYVINKNGNPLMPTNRHGNVRRMLKEGKSKVIKRTPFTIQLNYDATEYVDYLTLGVDSGSKTVGLSVTSEKQEYFSSEVTLRNDIVKLIATRAQARRGRRNRKTRYRKVRFLNRVKSKHKGWLAPSIEHKIQTHLKVIDMVVELLPISNIIVETASFDIQKIKNPEIKGKEYQEGKQAGFGNVRQYVLFRDGHKCQHCKGKSKDKVLNIHHIESRQTGGDAPNNLVTLCKTCHNLYHMGKINLKVKRGKSFRHAAFMGVMRKTFYDRLKNEYPSLIVEDTYGYITKSKRIDARLEKTHAVDAFCITGNMNAKRTDNFYKMKKVRRHNRKIHKAKLKRGGKRQNNQASFAVNNFRLFDKIRYMGVELFVYNRRTDGRVTVKEIDGTIIYKCINHKRIVLLEKRSGYLIKSFKHI